MTYQFALVLCLIIVSQAQTTKPPTVLCHSMCNKFFTNNNTFSNQVDMARNLTKISFFSSSYFDVVNHFGYYSSAFKQKQLATLLALKETSRYRNRTITAYGVTQINEYLGNTYPDGTCPLCSSLETDNGGVPPYPNMFEDYVLGDTLTDELEAASFMLSIPISKFPLFQFSRLLQPGTISIPNIEDHVATCPNNAYSLVQLANCLYEFDLAMEMVQNKYEVVVTLNDETQIHVDPTEGIEEELMAGFANLILNFKYQEVMLESYVNCLNNIYNTC